jgi:hypothetical protein
MPRTTSGFQQSTLWSESIRHTITRILIQYGANPDRLMLNGDMTIAEYASKNNMQWAVQLFTRNSSGEFNV